jgi:hypothetical protein
MEKNTRMAEDKNSLPDTGLGELVVEVPLKSWATPIVTPLAVERNTRTGPGSTADLNFTHS